MANLPDIVERLSQLTVLEASELSRLLEKKWGVSAAAPVATTTVVNTVVEQKAEEQTEFAVILAGLVSPDKKIAVIKEVRTITGLGLKEAKDFVESAPKVLREVANKDESAKIKETIEAVGGVVEIK